MGIIRSLQSRPSPTIFSKRFHLVRPNLRFITLKTTGLALTSIFILPAMAKAIASSRPFILSSATCKLPNTRRRFVSVTRAIDGAFSVKLGQLGGRSFAAGAANVSGAGSFDSPLIQSMENKIKEQLNADLVVVKDAYGDGRHVSIDVVASAFEGQSSVNRQRMVYKAIWDVLQNTVHAVDEMTTKTPNEAA